MVSSILLIRYFVSYPKKKNLIFQTFLISKCWLLINLGTWAVYSQVLIYDLHTAPPPPPLLSWRYFLADFQKKTCFFSFLEEILKWETTKINRNGFCRKPAKMYFHSFQPFLRVLLLRLFGSSSLTKFSMIGRLFQTFSFFFSYQAPSSIYLQ